MKAYRRKVQLAAISKSSFCICEWCHRDHRQKMRHVYSETL